MNKESTNIIFCEGDIFNSEMQTIVNTINCKGIMGAGLARHFRKKFPIMYEEYREKSITKQLKVGKPYIWKNPESMKFVLNFPSKNHYKDPSKMEWIEKGLIHFIERHKEWEVNSIAFPALGCNLGGLTWLEVKPVMTKYLSKIDIPIEIYEPEMTSMEKAIEKILNEIKAKYQKKIIRITIEREIFPNPEEWTNWKSTKEIKLNFILKELDIMKGIKKLLQKNENIHRVKFKSRFFETKEGNFKEIEETTHKQLTL